MSRELQLQLQAGDQIITTADHYFNHAPTVLMHGPGRVYVVNNPGVLRSKDGEIRHVSDSVGCNNSRGLGCSAAVGKFRMATPDDPGYRSTREQWWSIKDDETRKARIESFVYGVIAILSLGALAYVVMP